MARIRSLKPETPRDATLAKVPREVRYTFLLLLTQADDDGYFVATPRTLVGALYPHDPDVSETVLTRELDQLRAVGRLRAWNTPDGVIGEIVNFNKHQRIDHRSKSYFATLSRDPRETFGPGVLSLESRVLSPESRVAGVPARPSRGSVAPSPEPTDSSGAARERVPEGFRETYDGFRRASANPGAFDATMLDCGPGGMQAVTGATWAHVGQALREMASSGDAKFTATRLRGFIRRLVTEGTGRTHPKQSTANPFGTAA